MTPFEIERAIAQCESEIRASGDCDAVATAFWKAVGALKRRPDLIAEYAERVGAIDRVRFDGWAPLRVPVAWGTSLMLFATLVGLGLIGGAYGTGPPWNGLLFLTGTVALVVATHGLAHLAVGWVVGIRFTHWFVRRTRPQPGVKTDYASYLRTPPRHRAWMHAAGALASKAVPFLLLPAALISGIPRWAVAALLVFGAFQILTDATLSVRTSDWARYRREMRVARYLGQE